MSFLRCMIPNNTSNSCESTTMNTLENLSELSRSGQITISIKPPDHEITPSLLHPQFHKHPGMLYLIYAATLLYMFPSLMALVELKYQNKPYSPFETHGFFANMAAVAYIIAIAMSVALFCLKARSERSNPEIESPVYYRILQSVFYFSSLLAPLSLMLVLFFPHGFDFIGVLARIYTIPTHSCMLI
ncbi:hypothetical protein R6Q57_028633 [Mikania cordata]